jgi:non-canonical purine NTP pyrophosphatase (RdgB/HAM1 family)
MTFVTGNKAKAEQLSRYLDVPVLHEKIDLDEIQSLDLREVVEHKVKEAYRHLGKPVLIEDVSLSFTGLGRLPGPLIKWFLQELGNEGLCTLLLPKDDRRAEAHCMFAYYDGKLLKTFSGIRQGCIAPVPRGEAGFGWDPIFIPEGAEKTWAEMDKNEQSTFSMRRLALEQVKVFLEEIAL